MSVISVEERFQQRQSGDSVSTDGKYTRTHTRQFLIRTNSKFDGSATALSASGVPAVWDVHPEDVFASCRSRKVAPIQDDAAMAWLVTCEYSTETPDREESDEDNPLAEPVKRSVTIAKIRRAVWKDRDGDPIANTVGDAFDPPVEIEVSTPVLRFERNEPAYPRNAILNYVGKLNSTAFSGADPGTVMCTDISATEEFSKTVRYWKVIYEFTYSYFGWQPELLNQGVFQKVDGARVRIKDAKKEDVTEPVPLDNSGAAIGADQLPDSAVFITFDVYEEVDFNSLGLPTA